MACFLVPVAEALVVTATSHILEKRSQDTEVLTDDSSWTPFYKKLKWLSNLLWGGSALLAFEHFWHGEIEPFAPFLTAAKDPESTQVMLHEMATVGVSMAALITTVWLGIVAIQSLREKTHRTIALEEKGSAK